MHLTFAASMFGTAAFSHQPWQPAVPGDAFEDHLHSATATAMGFAFCTGVGLRLIQRRRGDLVGRALDVLALSVATALPIVLASSTTSGGLAQRVMFAVASPSPPLAAIRTSDVNSHSEMQSVQGARPR